MKKLLVVATLSIAVAAVIKRVTEKNNSHSKVMDSILENDYIQSKHLQTISDLLTLDK